MAALDDSMRVWNCPVCRSAARVLGAKDSVLVALCGACGHQFATAHPTAEELTALYGDYCYAGAEAVAVPPFIRSRVREVVRQFEPFRRTNRMLDLGFGAGTMLQEGRSLGWEVHGMELSSAAVKNARENGFDTAVEGDFLKAPYPEGTFDVIAAVEFIEHVPDPLPFLRQASRLLRPGGAIYLTTPNGAGVSGRLLGLDWSAMAPKEHLHLFSPLSLARTLEAAGFGGVEIRCEGVYPHEIAHRMRARLSGAEAGLSASESIRVSAVLNENLAASRTGAAFKAAANAFLRLAKLGDAMKVIGINRGR